MNSNQTLDNASVILRSSNDSDKAIAHNEANNFIVKIKEISFSTSFNMGQYVNKSFLEIQEERQKEKADLEIALAEQEAKKLAQIEICKGVCTENIKTDPGIKCHTCSEGQTWESTCHSKCTSRFMDMKPRYFGKIGEIIYPNDYDDWTWMEKI